MECAASSVYGDMNIIVHKHKQIMHGSGIKVGQANKNLIHLNATSCNRGGTITLTTGSSNKSKDIFKDANTAVGMWSNGLKMSIPLFSKGNKN